jgi:UDPglucose 6-dehydrogenase
LDARIGTRFLQAGIGWGGSCFAKDTAALISTAAAYDLTMPIVTACREVNDRQRSLVVNKLLSELKTLSGRSISLLGLAFKPDTDDLRDAPAIDLARRLLERGAIVKAHDPVAVERARREHPELGVRFCEDVQQAVANTDALVLVTEWPQYRDLDWQQLAQSMRSPFIVDGRNCLDRVSLIKAGFRYVSIGGPA